MNNTATLEKIEYEHLFDEMRDIKNKIRAIDHPVRRKLLNLIQEKSPVTVTDLLIKTRLSDQAVVSQHLGIMRRAGFLKTKRDGKYIYYSVSPKFAKFIKHIKASKEGKS